VTRRRETPAEARVRHGAVDDPTIVLGAAARLLEARPRSSAEVRRRLEQAGYQAGLVQGAIDRLADLGMLDDEAFARAWVESRDRTRPRGERALREELRRAGVAEEVIATVMEGRADAALRARGVGEPPVDADEAAALRLLDRRRAALLRERDPRTRRGRAYALLARNGFDPGVCASVAASWLAGQELDRGT